MKMESVAVLFLIVGLGSIFPHIKGHPPLFSKFLDRNFPDKNPLGILTTKISSTTEAKLSNVKPENLDLLDTSLTPPDVNHRNSARAVNIDSERRLINFGGKTPVVLETPDEERYNDHPASKHKEEIDETPLVLPDPAISFPDEGTTSSSDEKTLHSGRSGHVHHVANPSLPDTGTPPPDVYANNNNPGTSHAHHGHETWSRPVGHNNPAAFSPVNGTAIFVLNSTLNETHQSPKGEKTPLMPKQPHRTDLCKICLCSYDSSSVFCFHAHAHGNPDERDSILLQRSVIPRKTAALHIIGYHRAEVESKAFAQEDSLLKELVFEDVAEVVLHKHSLFFLPRSPWRRPAIFQCYTVRGSSIYVGRDTSRQDTTSQRGLVLSGASREQHQKRNRESYTKRDFWRKNQKVTIKFVNSTISRLPKETLTQQTEGRHDKKYIYTRERHRFLSLEFNECMIGVMEKNSLYRARLAYLIFSKVLIQNISSKAIDVDVEELSKFSKNRFPPLPHEAICLHSKTSVFVENYFEQLDNRSISIETEGQVLFGNNTIKRLGSGALMGIQPLRSMSYGATDPQRTYGASIIFSDNVLEYANPGSFTFSSAFSPAERTITRNSFGNVHCECNVTVTFQELLGEPPSSSSYDNLGSREFLCSHRRKFVSVSEYLAEECSPFPVVTVAAVGVAGILFIAAVTICVVCSIRVQRVKDEVNMLGDCASQSFSTLSRNYPDGPHYKDSPCEGSPSSPPPFAFFPWGLAIPEVKTYQQNETNEFTERTESIRGNSRRETLNRDSKNEFIPFKATTGERMSCPFN